MTIRVLIVDDSAFMRNALTKMLSSDPEITVVGTAWNGLDAIEKVAELKPDLVTMDIEMPRMDGIEALRRIMATNPVPVIMVSSITTEGAQATLDALDLGAVDFVPKNLSDLSVNIVKVREILIEKVKQIGRRVRGTQKAGPYRSRAGGIRTPSFRLPDRAPDRHCRDRDVDRWTQGAPGRSPEAPERPLRAGDRRTAHAARVHGAVRAETERDLRADGEGGRGRGSRCGPGSSSWPLDAVT